MSTYIESGLSRSGARAYLGAIVLTIAFAGGIGAFWFGLVSLTDAWATPEYSHGPIIPFISLFLFLREMHAVPPALEPPPDRWPGVAVILFGLALGLFGNLVRVDNIVTYAFIIWIAGLVLTCFGLRRGALFWPAVLHLVFMLPLPQFLYWQTSLFLQSVSSQIGVMIIDMVGIPVYLDGNVIDLGVYKLQVAEACSGLRYLYPMLSFSYVFAVLYTGPRWHKVVLLLSAAPITVLMNSFRIGMIGVLVNYFGIEHAEGFLHAFEGWIIFIACVVILFGETALLQKLARDRRSLSETLDLSFDGLPEQFRRIGHVVATPSLIVAMAVTVAVALGWGLSPDRTFQPTDRLSFVTFPKTLDGWSGRVNPPLDSQVEATLAADDYYSATYASEDSGPPVDLFMAYYYDQMDGTGIHSPQACLPAGGWEVSAWRQIEVDVGNSESFPLNRAIIQKGLVRQLVYFWFDLRGERLNGSWEAKFANMRDSMISGRSDGALIRLVTPLSPQEAETEADARLRRFMAPLMATLLEYVPE